MTRSLAAVSLLLVLLLVAPIGCSQGDRPDLAPVSGRVTLDGAPLYPGVIIFKPARGRASMGQLKADGSYTLVYLRDIEGAILGRHVVRVSDGNEDPRQSSIPARYNLQTELSATIERGRNTFDFALTSQ